MDVFGGEFMGRSRPEQRIPSGTAAILRGITAHIAKVQRANKLRKSSLRRHVFFAQSSPESSPQDGAAPIQDYDIALQCARSKSNAVGRIKYLQTDRFSGHNGLAESKRHLR